MQAEDIAAYFKKKIAKPILFDIEGAEQDGEQVHFYYSIEPTTVDNDVLHVIVNYKHAIQGKEKHETPPNFLGDVEIPLKDNDTVTSVLTMAAAWATFGAASEYVMSKDDQISLSYQELNRRLKERFPSPKL